MLKLRNGISANLRKGIILSSLSPLYIILVTGFISGVVLALVRLDFWQFVFPLLLNIIPYLLVVYLFMYFIFIFAVWLRGRELYDLVKCAESGIKDEKEFIELADKLVRFPLYVAILSFMFWVLSVLLTILVLYFGDISDFQTTALLAVLIFSLSFPVSALVYFSMERYIIRLLDGVQSLPWKIYPSMSYPLRHKFFYFLVSVLIFSIGFTVVLSSEINIRSLKTEKSKIYFEAFLRGERVQNALHWTAEFDRAGKLTTPFIDDVVLDAIYKKLKRGENILFDYASPGVYIFTEIEGKVDGVFLPMFWVEDRVKDYLLLFFPVALFILFLVSGVFFGSIGRNIEEVFRGFGRRVILTGDEFFQISLHTTALARDLEEINSKYSTLALDMGNNLSRLFNDMISLRVKISSAIDSLKSIRLSLNNIFQYAGREIIEIEFYSGQIIERASDDVISALRELIALKEKFSEMINELQQVNLSASINLPKDALSINLLEERYSVLESSLMKRIEFLRNSVVSVEGIISKVDERIRDFRNVIKDIFGNMKQFEGIYSDIDRLKKKFVILSMNASIISAKEIHGAGGGEFSTIAKQMSSLLNEELRKLEIGIRNLGDFTRSSASKIDIMAADGSFEDVIEGIRGAIGRVEDLLDDLALDLKQVIDQANEMKGIARQIVSFAFEAEENISRVYAISGHLNSLGSEVAHCIERVIKRMDEAVGKVASAEGEAEKLLRHLNSLSSKYQEMVRTMKSAFSEIRSESKKLIEILSKLEDELKSIRSVVDRTCSFVENMIQKYSLESF